MPIQATTTKTEVIAGVTTFLTMAYILFVQPAVLSTDFTGKPTGLDFGAVLLATCIVSGAATILMGLWAKYPIALAPGMGENFFFVSVIMALAAAGVPEPWRVALGIVFISGVIFLTLSVMGVREAVLDSISPSMRNAIAAGIGLFVAFIGLRNGGLLVSHPGTLVTLNPNLLSADVAVFAVGLITTAVLHIRGVRGAMLVGIVAAALAAAALDKIQYVGVFGLPHVMAPAAFRFDIATAASPKLLPFVAVFLFMNVFDTIGSVIGVTQQAGLIRDGKLPRAERVLVVDAAGTVLGAALGTSTIVTYIESAAGVSAGGRTGLTAVVAGSLFFVALLFSPLIGMIGNYLPITAPALIVVGAMMMSNASRIEWEDASESVPAFLTMAGIPLTYSIADGLALGFITYPVLKLLTGQAQQIGKMSYAISALLIVYFVFVRTALSS
jgi:AGZA family xanthine/uracil permease-like MFS transporter